MSTPHSLLTAHPGSLDGSAAPATDAESTPATTSGRRRDLVASGSLAALLLATGVLYLWQLDASGYANSFYSAAAQAGSQDWAAWFWGSLDAGNAITVDKPPASLWIMGLSVRLFGLSSWSILVPQALMGVGTVAIVYATVRRVVLHGRFGVPDALPRRFAHGTGMVAALVTAVTPVAVLMFRFNNPDALLVLLVTAATALTLRAAENGRRLWLVGAGVAIGFAFLTKMLQAFVVLPALVLAYAIGANVPWRRKIVDLLAAFAAVLVSAGWYVAIFELTPAELRPYMGGTQTDSFLELVFGYNGLGRITGTEVGSVGGGQGGPGTGEQSLLRMFTGVSGGMVSWLIPAALILAVAAVVLLTRRARGPMPDAAGSESPDPDADGSDASSAAPMPNRLVLAAIAAFAGTLIITGLVFSLMEGIYHDYYTVALAPAIGATLALGGAVTWLHRGRLLARFALAVSALATGVWSFVLLNQAGSLYGTLGWGVLIVSVVAAGGLAAASKLPRALAGAALVGALVSGSAGPTAYALNTAATPHTGSIVTAGPVQSTGFGGGARGPGGPGGQRTRDGQAQGTGTPGGTAGQAPTGGRAPAGGQMPTGGQTPAMPGQTDGTNTGTAPTTGTSPTTSNTGDRGGGAGMGGLLNGATASSEVVALLQADAASYTWAAAAIGSQNAASYQLASGAAVMAIGGFNGSDPAPTLEEFQQLVAEGTIHYFLGGDLGGQQNGGSEAASEIATWVSENFTATTVGSTTVYDLTAQG